MHERTSFSAATDHMLEALSLENLYLQLYSILVTEVETYSEDPYFYESRKYGRQVELKVSART